MRDDLAPAWRKSSYSANQGACVELSGLPTGTAVRDSKDPAGPVLMFTPAAWSAWTAGVRSGQFG